MPHRPSLQLLSEHALPQHSKSKSVFYSAFLVFSSFPPIRSFKVLHDLAPDSILKLICFQKLSDFRKWWFLKHVPALRLSTCVLCQKYCLPRCLYFMTNTPTSWGFLIQCYLLEKDLAIPAKTVRQQPPSHSTTLSHFIFGHRALYHLKSHKISSCLHVCLPLKCGFPKYRIACSYYHLQKNNGQNIYSMNATCYMGCSMPEVQQ